MNKDEVPQDSARAFQGRTKALYAVDENGRYQMVSSSGWEAEEIVLDQAIAQYEEDAAQALERCRNGTGSPLEYHMFRRRMDVLLLAQSTGFFRWQVKRHLKPGAFAGLSTNVQCRYAEALGLTVDELCALPDGA